MTDSETKDLFQQILARFDKIDKEKENMRKLWQSRTKRKITLGEKLKLRLHHLKRAVKI